MPDALEQLEFAGAYLNVVRAVNQYLDPTVMPGLAIDEVRALSEPQARLALEVAIGIITAEVAHRARAERMDLGVVLDHLHNDAAALYDRARIAAGYQP